MESIVQQIVSRQLESIPLIANYTCTLLKNLSNYKLHGTGVFIKIGNLHLLVSAAHVFDDFNELFIPIDNGKTLIRPGGNWYVSPYDYEKEAKPKLVGIMTDWSIKNRKIIIATRIDTVTEILRIKKYINFPESELFSFK